MQLECGVALVCQNNVLSENSSISCEEPVVRDFGNESQSCDAFNNVCVEGNNDGDQHSLGCPAGTLLAIQAACNLEFGKATDQQRDGVLLNRLKVVRESDKKKRGQCIADDSKISAQQRLVMPWLVDRYEASNSGRNTLRYACKEHDKNGGDCHVNIRHYCERVEIPPVE